MKKTEQKEVQLSKEEFNIRMTTAKKSAAGYYMNSLIHELHGKLEKKQWLEVFEIAKEIEQRHRALYDEECVEKAYS